MATKTDTRPTCERLPAVNKGGNTRDLIRIYLLALILFAALGAAAYTYATHI